MRTVDCVQGEGGWLDARCGRITASRMSAVLAVQKKTGGEYATRSNYRAELMVERLTGKSVEHYVSEDMENGTAGEPYARAAYEIERGVMVDTVGFVLHPSLDFWGSSPDGLLQDGGIEIKYPRSTTHLKWLLDGVLPEKHEPQVVSNMICCECSWWDFVSFCPEMPAGLRLFIVRVQRDEKRIAQIEQEVIRFNEEIEAALEPLRSRIIVEPGGPQDTTRLTNDVEYLDSLMDVVGAEIIP